MKFNSVLGFCEAPRPAGWGLEEGRDAVGVASSGSSAIANF
jgi:hypothetical protein